MWRETLRTLITSGSFRTQGQLVSALAAAGHSVSQGTVSRELATLGVEKANGAYRLPADAILGAPVHSLSFAANDCLAVVKTDPAFAGIVAHFIDNASIDGMLGTIAGEDTVFVALLDTAAADRLAARLGHP